MARYSKTLTPEAAGKFLAALEGGATVEAAAQAAGVALSTLYCRRERDPAFAAAWDQATARSSGPVLVWNQAGRRYQKQRSRRTRFTRERKQVFLGHFAGSCNLAAAAEAAGVSADCVYDHLRCDPAFGAGFEEALRTGYTLLEAEAVAQQRESQKRYTIHPGRDAGEFAQSFERTMQLLREYHRGQGQIGRRPGRGIRPRVATNEEVRAALTERLAAFRARVRARLAAAGEETQGEAAPPDPARRAG